MDLSAQCFLLPSHCINRVYCLNNSISFLLPLEFDGYYNIINAKSINICGTRIIIIWKLLFKEKVFRNTGKTAETIVDCYSVLPAKCL